MNPLLSFIDHSKLFLTVQHLIDANALLADEKALLEQEVLLLKSKYADLLEQVRLLKHQRFGASSEKYAADQQDLFNEVEEGFMVNVQPVSTYMRTTTRHIKTD